MGNKVKIAPKRRPREVMDNTGMFDDYLSLEGLPVGSVTTLNRDLNFGNKWCLFQGDTVKITAKSEKTGEKGKPDETETVVEFLDVSNEEMRQANEQAGTMPLVELNVHSLVIPRRTITMSKVFNPETKGLDTVITTENHY